jgi:hypothetical protein
MFARRRIAVASAAVLAAVMAGYAAAASPAVCNMRLAIELTPDVPEPLDAGFLSSLLNNKVSYRLTLLSQQPGSVIVTELVGPGPEYRCRKVVETMRRDARVLSVHLDRDGAMHPLSGGVPPGTLDLRPPDLRSLDDADRGQIGTSPDFDAAQAVTIAAVPLALEETPEALAPPGGIAALYWAARHPAQAWRVFLPIQLEGDSGANPAPLKPADSAGG